MNLKERLIDALPAHAERFTNIRGSVLYVKDLKAIGGGNAIIECTATGIAAVELQNPNSITVDFDSFPENALPLSEGNYESQCECVLFPEDSDVDEWVLFIETKYAKSLESVQCKEYDYPQQMVKQIKQTVAYFREKNIIAPDKKVYAIVSFPLIYEGYESWTFPERYDDGSEESVENIMDRYKIHIRATNYATIKNLKKIKLAHRYVPRND